MGEVLLPSLFVRDCHGRLKSFILLFSASCTLISPDRGGDDLPQRRLFGKLFLLFFMFVRFLPSSDGVVDLQEGTSRVARPRPHPNLRPQNVVSCQNPERQRRPGPAAKDEPQTQSTPRSHSVTPAPVSVLGPPSSSHILSPCAFSVIFLNATQRQAPTLFFFFFSSSCRMLCVASASGKNCLHTVDPNLADPSSAVMSVSAFFLQQRLFRGADGGFSA